MLDIAGGIILGVVGLLVLFTIVEKLDSMWCHNKIWGTWW